MKHGPVKITKYTTTTKTITEQIVSCNYFEPKKRISEKYVSDLKRNSTPQEDKIYYHLRHILKKQYKIYPIFQHVIHNSKTFYIIDIFIPKAKICIELDGRHHFDSPKQKEHDKIRDNFLRSIGLKVLRFPNSLIDKDYRSVLNCITGAVRVSLGGNSLRHQGRAADAGSQKR